MPVGGNDEARHCLVRAAFDDGTGRVGPAKLGVRLDGFIGRVSVRAAAEGLTVYMGQDEFSPLNISTWSEPETGQDTGPGRPVRFVVMPGAAPNAHGVAEIGNIVVSGPPR